MRSRGSDNRYLMDKPRVFIAGAMILFVFFFYGRHLYRLQILEGSEYTKQASAVSRRSVTIPAQRGEIYDRNYSIPLAVSVPSFAVDMIPAYIADEQREMVITDLLAILNMERDAFDAIVPEYRYRSWQSFEIKTNVSLDQISKIAEKIDRFPGISWHDKPARQYLSTGSVSHVLGYVSDIDLEKWQILYNKGYSRNDIIGMTGVESEYDQILKGSHGRYSRTVDARGRDIADSLKLDAKPVNGRNLVLTIDMDIQILCEQALGERMGAVVVLRPATGEVLAMVSYPWFDPNTFSHEFEELSRDPKNPLLNRAVQSSSAPASTFKVILSLAALEENAIDPEELIDCAGSIILGNEQFDCHIIHKQPEGHGPLNLAGGLAESCNVYFWTLGREYLGVDNIVNYAKECGLGQITGIDLPVETPGLVPSPEWKDQARNAPWVGGDTMNMSIGQGDLSVTPIQMANLTAMIVNDGVVYQPHLLKEIRDPVSGEIVERVESKVLRSSSISRETFATVRDNMRGVVTDGTANVVITTEAVQVAAKTGTGQVTGTDESWDSWFISYGPYNDDDPREKIVVVVKVDAANDWEWWAPKAANLIYQGIFADQTYEEAVDALKWWWWVKPREEAE